MYMQLNVQELEIKFFRQTGVYTKVHRSEAVAARCSVITTRFLDINNGDDLHPDLRSSLVG